MDKCSGHSWGVALCYRSILVRSLHGIRSLLTIGRAQFSTVCTANRRGSSGYRLSATQPAV